GFDTRYETMVEAALGGFEPTGRLPITFPCDASAIAVDDRGVCASPTTSLASPKSSTWAAVPMSTSMPTAAATSSGMGWAGPATEREPDLGRSLAHPRRTRAVATKSLGHGGRRSVRV